MENIPKNYISSKMYMLLILFFAAVSSIEAIINELFTDI